MLLLMVPLALAAPDGLALKLTDPRGEVIAEQLAPLPLALRLEQTLGGQNYTIAVRSEAGDGITLDVAGPRHAGSAALPLGEGGHTVAQVALRAPRAARAEVGQKPLTWTLDVQRIEPLTPLPHDPEPPADWPQRSFALAWDDAGLYADPRDREASERSRVLPEGRQDPATQASPMRVVAHWEARRVELETVVSQPEAHCHINGPPPRGYAFQYFVSRDDLVPVTTREVRVDHPDGSGLTLAAGVAVRPLPDGRYGVTLDGVQFEVDLPEDAVGLQYRPSGHFLRQETGLTLTPDAQGVLGTLGGTEVHGAQPWVVQGRQGLVEPIVTLRTDCAELRLRAEPERLTVAP
ncbi:MAG: hypothetical protein H6739_36950 [Alphaproteobacteria bacterium]|nr:hypothetical protein [Alphaproteobacteria bacterium]